MGKIDKYSAYAIAKCCGYSKSFEDFKKEYSQYLDEIYKEEGIKNGKIEIPKIYNRI